MRQRHIRDDGRPGRRGPRIAAGLGVLAAAGLCGAAIWLLVARTIIPGLGRMTHGYPGYHTASYLLVHGEWGPQAYDNAWYAARVRRLLGQPVAEIISPNLPTVTLLALPLIGMTPQAARDAWVWANLPLLLAALALLAWPETAGRGAPARGAIWLGFAAAALLLPATRANFRIGQAYIVLLLLFAVAFRAINRGRDGLAGAALGLAFMLKASGLPVWLVFVRRRGSVGRRGLAACLLTCALLFAATLPWIGLASWLAYPAALARSTSGPPEAVTAYQNTLGWLTHLFLRDAGWNPAPLVDWPWLIRGLFLLIAGGTLGLTLRRGGNAQQDAPGLFAGALLTLSVVLLPLAEEHQYVLLLPPLAAWLRAWLDRVPAERRRGEWLPPLLALALLLLPAYYKGAAWTVGWRALAAYPRLYGGWLLWLALLRAMPPGGSQAGMLRLKAWIESRRARRRPRYHPGPARSRSPDQASQ